MVGGVHLDQSDVVVDVPPDDFRRDAVAVLELDVQLVAGLAFPGVSPALVITCEFVRM